jgi:hypothetical protein
MNELWQSNYTFQEECKKSIDIKTTYILSLEAHIAELEALQAPKSCQLCRYWTDSSLQHCTYNDIDTTNIYHYCEGCTDYEQKDSK